MYRMLISLLLADADIGIIAPYHAQCLKLRSALRNVAESVKIGSVEEFQGQVCIFFPF
jgi:helicase MOV-10